MKLSGRVALRLAKICGMFGSSHEGERANAAAAADALLRQNGLTWAMVVGIDEEVLDDFDRVVVCQEHVERLSDWEKEFIDGIGLALARGRRLTVKQAAVLARIFTKVEQEK